MNEARLVLRLVVDELHALLVTLRDRIGREDVAAVIEQDAGFGRTHPVEQQVERGEIVIPIGADYDQPAHLIAWEGRKETRADA